MRIRGSIGVLTAAGIGLVWLSPAVGHAQFVQTDASSPIQVDQINPFLLTFGDLAGITVNWTTTGGSGSGIWGSLGGGTCGVAGANFSLSADCGDQTYFGLWNLSGQGVTDFSINPLTANKVFDIVNYVEDTPGSSLGEPFGYCNINFGFFCLWQVNDQWSTVVTYSKPVGVGGNDPIGDLWGGIDVAFGNTFGVQQTCEKKIGSKIKYYDCSVYDVSFTSDADQFGQLSNPEEIPEPGTLSLLALGLTGLAGAGRRRLRRS